MLWRKGSIQHYAKREESMLYTIPNLLTLFRLVLIPVFVVVFYLDFPGQYAVCAIIFALAAITDWLDGYLARKLQQTSPFGAFFDPVVDKLMVVLALVLLVSRDAGIALTLSAGIIICREILVSALREWMAELSQRGHVAVSMLGKYKTATQMVAIPMLIMSGSVASPELRLAGNILLYIAVVLTLYSMLIYLKAAWPFLAKAR
jgi:CDP-diacylglycerol--glycerol-3-phosphate 3-phosphatidyltransferase